MSDAGLRFEVGQQRPVPLAGAFDCAAGELLALVGPSGAGKTSMLRVLAGLAHPAEGRVQVGDVCWFDAARGLFVPPQRRHVGMVFQHFALMPHLDAVDNVALSLLHLPRRQRLQRAGHALERVRLSPEQQRRRPQALSGGEQQRVAVARALAREPRLLLLDEPFSAVDAPTRQSLYALLAELRRDLHIPIVLVTHDLREAALLADRLAVVDAGQVLQQGRPEAIQRAPRNARVADIVGIRNRFAGRWLGPAEAPGWARLAWTVPQRPGDEPLRVLTVRDKGRLQPGQAVTWVVPGEALSLRPPPAQAADEFAVVVAHLRHLGELTLATLQVGGEPQAQVQIDVSGPPRRQLAEGAPLTLHIDLGLVHVMPVRT